MAKKEGNPEIKDGHIQIANELYEAIFSSDFTERELRVIFSIIRWTYGYNRKTAKLSCRDIALRAGLKDRFGAAKACRSLLQKAVIFRQKTGSRFIWGLNKYYRNWDVKKTTLSGEQIEDPRGQKDNDTPDIETPLYREPVTGVALSKTPPKATGDGKDHKVWSKRPPQVMEKTTANPELNTSIKDKYKDRRTAKIICPRCKGKKIFRVPLGDGTIIKQVCGHCKGKGRVWRQGKGSQHN